MQASMQGLMLWGRPGPLEPLTRWKPPSWALQSVGQAGPPRRGRPHPGPLHPRPLRGHLWGRGSLLEPSCQADPPCQRGPQSCLCVAAGRGLGGCWRACLELTSCPPEGLSDEGGPWGVGGDQPPWLLLLYILRHPGWFLLKCFEMRTWVAQQMPSSVVGPGSSVWPRMRTGRWALWTWGTGTCQGRCHRAPTPRAQGRCWLNEDLPRSLATGTGPCTCQQGSAQNSTRTAGAASPPPGCDPAPML